ncbi:hypothetical protein PVL29_014699 [Vitis rotundifolia]|uniref:Retrotransposon gag domain-containing protein n=1 Tax=Vitis rotundifolia TaxID=103349 RepID=A0AA39DLS0_VITRO|nr:hypothetical protein PVL29_014699 [Vitis rotundifolia]
MPRAKNKLTTRPRQTTRLSPLSHGDGTKGRNVSLIQEFKALIPPIFRGSPNFLKVENWLKEIKKILDVMAVPKEMRVSLASFMLKDETNNWWDMLKTTQDVTQMAWIQFEELLLSNYFLETIRR